MSIIDVEKLINPIKQPLTNLSEGVALQQCEQEETEADIATLQERIQILSQKMGVNLPEPEEYEDALALEIMDNELNRILVSQHLTWTKSDFKKLPALSQTDLMVCGVAGMVSVLVDVLLVGCPEVVKIYRGGERFDGSVLTALFRKVGTGEGNLSSILGWFEQKCKVPYDISLVSGVVTPNNHRLRSLGHDPFFGLLFAIADILMGTTTCIDNTGALSILMNGKPVPTSEKLLAVFYYFGHLISDMCTARGLPIPGFFLTQFFTNINIGNQSLAKIAEGMYLDGYDLRHFLSMQTSVWVKDILLNTYLKLSMEEEATIRPLAHQELSTLHQKLRKEKMLLLANSIGTTGNLIKFLAPPSNGNPCAINLPQWLAMARSGLVTAKALTRDTSVEESMYNRELIDQRWEALKL